MDNVIRAMARQQLNGQAGNPDDLARRESEEQAVADAQAEANYQAYRQMKVGRAEDEGNVNTLMRRNSKSISYGWGSLNEPSMPGLFDE